MRMERFPSIYTIEVPLHQQKEQVVKGIYGLRVPPDLLS